MMKHTMLVLLLGLFALLSSQAQTAGQFSSSATAMTPTRTKPKPKKLSLSDHVVPDHIESPKVRAGFETLENGDVSKAADQLDDFAGNDPDAAFGLGVAYLEGGKPAKAIDALNRSLRLDANDSDTGDDEDDSDVYYVLGLAYAETGNYVKAEEAFLAALELNNEDADIWYELGFLYADAGMKDAAEECLDHVLKIDPEYRYRY